MFAIPVREETLELIYALTDERPTKEQWSWLDGEGNPHTFYIHRDHNFKDKPAFIPAKKFWEKFTSNDDWQCEKLALYRK